MRSNSSADLIVLIFMLGFIGAVIAFVLFVWGTIFKKAGFSFWTCLLMFIPFVNFIWLLVFAFSKWPIQSEIERARMGYTGGFPVMPAPQPPVQQR